ncbi:MAG TPA: hypothetical protein PLP83_07995 [Candidatus Aminicenantes bacterium]|nr:hypothetical protein [Candidatus Aminicenantes bacterium]
MALAAGPPAERTLFRELAPSDPVREALQALFDRPAASVRRGFTDRDWAVDGFAAAWDRARRYFPARTYYVRPGAYFMTHGFDAGGRRFMEVHDSDFLGLCAANRRTFTAGGVVAEYARMRGAGDGGEAAAFRAKLGRLESAFLDEASLRRGRDALGAPLHRRLLEALREENGHMLAAGLIHEGVHAGVDEASAARLQGEFRAGRLPVQWDELGAFMAEAVYHARFCRWAAADMEGSTEGVRAALRELEKLRRLPRLEAGKGRAAFARARARAWAFAALARLRMRESWQSALRLRALVAGFREDYVRGAPPDEVAEGLAAYDRDAAAFVEAVGRAVQGMELALRSAEETLDVWDDWADRRRPYPPPNIDSLAAARRMAAVAWPAPPVESGRALMRRAERALAAERSPR